MTENGSDADTIATALDTMGFDAAGTGDQTGDDAGDDEPADMRNEHASVPAFGGAQPTVKYTMANAGITSARLAKALNGRLLQVASVILKHKSGITKRDLRDSLEITNGAAMSAIHGLQTRGFVKSVPLPGAVPAGFAAKRSATAGKRSARIPAQPVRRSLQRGAARR